MYIEVLYTIANTVGASTGQYAHYKEDLYRYAQEAFGVPSDQHRRYLNIASEEKVYRFIDFLLESAVSFLIAKNILLKYHYWRYNNTCIKLNFYLSLQPPIVVLSVVVIEADGLEAKDVNGKCIPFRYFTITFRILRAIKNNTVRKCKVNCQFDV